MEDARSDGIASEGLNAEIFGCGHLFTGHYLDSRSLFLRTKDKLHIDVTSDLNLFRRLCFTSFQALRTCFAVAGNRTETTSTEELETSARLDFNVRRHCAVSQSSVKYESVTGERNNRNT